MFITFLKSEGYNEQFIENAGLAFKAENKPLVDRFRNRVIFPIQNLSGKTIAFGARILSEEKNQPKYINSPETSLYIKSNTLYGLYQSKNSIRKMDNCYLVEGYTDVISMHKANVKNVVASSGTSLTEGQIRLIKRFTNNIVILYDGDAAGINASFRGIDLVLKEGLSEKVEFSIHDYR